MKYELEDLVPIVAKLAEGYTSKESTSITYEKASQLMEAVIYSINEGESWRLFSIAQQNELTPKRMYEIGAKCVEEKTKETLKLYNELMTHFSSYDNECLRDTVSKGLPEFFKWYDFKYNPQNTILTLDYPVLMDISEHIGIDKIYNFVLCIQLEQKFLNVFPYEFVVEILARYDKKYEFIIENVCEIVLMNILIHILAEKKISVLDFEAEEYSKIQEFIKKYSLSDLREALKDSVDILIMTYYDNDKKLMEYLYKAVDNISVRIKCAADNGNLHCIL